MEVIKFWLVYWQFALLTSPWFYPMLLLIFNLGVLIGYKLKRSK